MQWHSMLREGLIKTSIFLPCYYKKWGRLTPDRRFNVDQVSMLFAIDYKTTFKVNVEKEDKRNHHVWVADPEPGQ